MQKTLTASLWVRRVTSSPSTCSHKYMKCNAGREKKK